MMMGPVAALENFGHSEVLRASTMFAVSVDVDQCLVQQLLSERRRLLSRRRRRVSWWRNG